MDWKKFTQILRIIVREEVESALDKKLGNKPNFINKKEVTESNVKKSAPDMSKHKNSMKFSKDPAINSMLLETANSAPIDSESITDVVEQINTDANPIIDKIFNRNYSDLVSKFNK